jgi:hypothetical protein
LVEADCQMFCSVLWYPTNKLCARILNFDHARWARATRQPALYFSSSNINKILKSKRNELVTEFHPPTTSNYQLTNSMSQQEVWTAKVSKTQRMFAKRMDERRAVEKLVHAHVYLLSRRCDSTKREVTTVWLR